jgi:probable F420-dependent oxidoreductase
MGRPELAVQVWGTQARELVARARLAESLGFDAVSVPDHLTDSVPPPLIACSIIASATERIRVGTLVLNNDLRHPVLLAREVAMLADQSGGRFELGLGAGYARVEYEHAGIPYDPAAVRIARLCESVQIVRRLLAGEQLTFAGEHYQVAGERCAPIPALPVPIYVGGNSAALHACAAEFADAVGLVGFDTRTGGASIVVSDFTREAFERQLARLRGQAGDGYERLARHVLVQDFEVTDERDAVLARLAPEYDLTPDELATSPYVAIGSAGQIARQLQDLHGRAGIGRFTVFADKPGAPPLESLAPVIELLAHGAS